MRTQRTWSEWARLVALVVLGSFGWGGTASASADPPSQPPVVADFDKAYKEINDERLANWTAALALLEDGELTMADRIRLDDLADEDILLGLRAHRWYEYGMRYPEIYGQSSLSFSWLEGQIASDVEAIERLADS